MKQNIDISSFSGGIKCDNENCNWFDNTVTDEQYPEYLNKPCPECGSNLLTQQDLDAYINLKSTLAYINTLSEDELHRMNVEIYGEDYNKLIDPDGIYDVQIGIKDGNYDINFEKNERA